MSDPFLSYLINTLDSSQTNAIKNNKPFGHKDLSSDKRSWKDWEDILNSEKEYTGKYFIDISGSLDVSDIQFDDLYTFKDYVENWREEFFSCKSQTASAHYLNPWSGIIGKRKSASQIDSLFKSLALLAREFVSAENKLTPVGKPKTYLAASTGTLDGNTESVNVTGEPSPKPDSEQNSSGDDNEDNDEDHPSEKNDAGDDNDEVALEEEPQKVEANLPTDYALRTLFNTLMIQLQKTKGNNTVLQEECLATFLELLRENQLVTKDVNDFYFESGIEFRTIEIWVNRALAKNENTFNGSFMNRTQIINLVAPCVLLQDSIKKDRKLLKTKIGRCFQEHIKNASAGQKVSIEHAKTFAGYFDNIKKWDITDNKNAEPYMNKIQEILSSKWFEDEDTCKLLTQLFQRLEMFIYENMLYSNFTRKKTVKDKTLHNCWIFNDRVKPLDLTVLIHAKGICEFYFNQAYTYQSVSKYGTLKNMFREELKSIPSE